MAALLATVIFAVHGFAQSTCVDPPTQGFVQASKDNPLVLSDGYQTRLDAYFPARTPGSCGWPTVLFVHSNRSSKEAMEEHCRRFAARGYAALAFDLRGQGPSMALNNPAVYGRGALGLRERLDIAEVVEQADALFPTQIDLDRLGLTGPTQGGFYGWAMAAHSGRIPPANPWRTAPFPTFAAVAVHDFDIDAWEWMVPGGTNVSEMFVFNVLQSAPGLAVDPAFRAMAMPLVQAGDFATLRANIDPPELHVPTLLETSTVPILATLSYDDMFGSANSTVDAWPHIVPGAQKKLNLTNSGHRSPRNNRERALRQHREQIWFDFHLRGVTLPEDLPDFRYALIPDEASVCLSPGALWDNHQSDTDPMAAATTMRFYLGANSSLSPSPSIVGVGTDTISNVNATGYDIDDYITDELTAEEMLQIIPLDTEWYDSQAQPHDTFIAGKTVARLPLFTSAADFLIQVSLLDVAPNGDTRYVTGGFHTERGHTGGMITVDVPIATYGYRLPAGHKLRVQIENHAWHRPPMEPDSLGEIPSFLRALPVFSPFTLSVVRSANHQPYIEFPAIQPEAIRIAAAQPKLDGASPSHLPLSVFTDAGHAGWNFQFIASFAGTMGSFQWQGTTIPLVSDQLARIILGVGGGAPLPTMRGFLDADGMGSGTLKLGLLQQLPASAEGLSIVVRIGDGSGTAEVSEPITLTIE